MRLSELEGTPVIDGRDRVVGKVARGVFHAEKPVFVGVEVRMRPWFYIIERPRRYVATSQASMKRSGVRLVSAKRPEREGAHKRAEDWENAVVWVGQQVLTESGVDMGCVRDVELDGEGRVMRVELTGGTTRDVAVGKREVAGEHVIGFDGNAVRVAEVARTCEFGGGLAAGAGRGAARARVTAGKAASAATKGAIAASVAALRTAKRAQLGGGLGGAWKGFAQGVKEGMRDGEDER